MSKSVVICYAALENQLRGHVWDIRLWEAGQAVRREGWNRTLGQEMFLEEAWSYCSADAGKSEPLDNE